MMTIKEIKKAVKERNLELSEKIVEFVYDNGKDGITELVEMLAGLKDDDQKSFFIAAVFMALSLSVKVIKRLGNIIVIATSVDNSDEISN